MQETMTDPNRAIGTVDKSFYLIGVGASAGGLDAIKQLISRIPKGFPHSLVIVQHISPDYKSFMAEILGRETSMPVCEVTDDMQVEPRHIYLIPPRSNIVIQGTKGDSSLALTDDHDNPDFTGLRFSLVVAPPRPNMNLPIDVFFTSLAEAVGGRSVAIVLSGTGSDGSRGLRAIKDREGFVLAQEPETSAFDGMPLAAISTGIVDLVLPPDEMIGELLRYFQMRESGILNVDAVFRNADRAFSEVLALVSTKAEIDFSLYKEPTLKRRIARRMALAGQESLDEYLHYVRENSSEVNALHREFLVGVTNFFRDAQAWQDLEAEVLKDLFASGAKEDPLRVWSAGCSTGEEAYTVAMVLERYRRDHGIERDFRVFATDVNDHSIQTAKQGIYPDTIREEIPEPFLNPTYLQFQSGTFSVSRNIRKKVIFATHNVVDDPPYTQIDLIICRNLLIYLSPEIQAKVLTQFSFSLQKGGALFLGAAESSGQYGGMFEQRVGRSRIYLNSRRIERQRGRFRTGITYPSESILPRTTRLGRSVRTTEDIESVFTTALEATRSCLFILEASGKLIQSFGNHESILVVPKSGFSPNILDLVDERLRSSFSLVLRRAELDGEATQMAVKLTGENDIRLIDLSCKRTSWEAHPVAYAVTCQTRLEAQAESRSSVRQAGRLKESSQKAYVSHLESEIQSLQDMLSVTAEDLGASNEELQSTNEELISANEELQANNEETESINEELHTVNVENVEKIAELEAATSDIRNLLESIEVGILLLDNSLRIRLFSHGFKAYIDLEDADIGRSIENFSFAIQPTHVVQLMDDIRLTRASGRGRGREVQLSVGRLAAMPDPGLCRSDGHADRRDPHAGRHHRQPSPSGQGPQPARPSGGTPRKRGRRLLGLEHSGRRQVHEPPLQGDVRIRG